MKKVFFALFVSSIYINAAAQDRVIEFVEGMAWEEVVELGRRNDRPIFVDCYTDWCGPCKRVAAEVFTLNEVADFFNDNFVNAKFEMEKSADGPMLVEKYRVVAYPTFLFIDPHTEELLYVKLGAGQGHQWLIDAGNLALDPSLNKAAMERRYSAGERDFMLIKNYIKLLGSMDMKALQVEITEQYLDAHSGEGLFTHETWEIITQSSLDPLSRHFVDIVNGREKLYEINGNEEVDRYLETVIRKAATDIILNIWYPNAFRRVDDAEERHTKLIAQYSRIVDYQPAEVYLAFLETADMIRNKQWDQVLDKMAAVDKSGILDERQTYDYYRYNLIPLARDGGNAEQVERAVAMLDSKIAATTDSELNRQYRTFYNNVKHAR